MKLRMFNIVTISMVSMLTAFSPQSGDERFRITAGAVSLVPHKGQFEGFTKDDNHIILQFYRIPGKKLKGMLRSRGIRLLRYLGGQSYLVENNNPVEAVYRTLPEIRSALRVRPEMKMSHLFVSDGTLRARLQSGRDMAVIIRFHREIAPGTVRELLESNGINATEERIVAGNNITVRATRAELEALLRLDEVDFIDPALPKPRITNKISAERSNVKVVREKKRYSRADGSGIQIGLWDVGRVDTHTDFENRLTVVEYTTTASDHATHVAGTMAGAGILNGFAKGMAPGSKLYSYTFFGDPTSEMYAAFSQYGIDVTNHSWGFSAGWGYEEGDEGEDDYWEWYGDWQFGYYHSYTSALDRLAYSRDLLIVRAVGNERSDAYLGPHRHEDSGTDEFQDLHPSDPDYASLPVLSVAKNVLTVGATMKDDIMTSFSSWGPTDDGRVKPDVVADGYQLYSTTPGNTYDRFSGTSMSSPSVAGTAALIMDYYRLEHGEKPSAVMTKNLLIHSARDLGNEGPDYTFGFGMIDAELAAKVIKSAVFNDSGFAATGSSSVVPTKKHKKTDTVSMMLSDSLSHKGKEKYFFDVPENTPELRVTLVWHDPPGSKLINNLDVYIRPQKGKRVFPYSLYPNDPGKPAARKRNKLDNIEHILVKNPDAGKWRIFVRGKSIPDGPQKYTLIVSASPGNNQPELLTEGTMEMVDVFTSTSTDWDNLIPKQTIDRSDEFFLYARVDVPENANYDGYYGTISAHWTVKNSVGSLIFKSNTASEGFWPRNYPWRWRVGLLKIPNDMPSGPYLLEVTLTMHNGITETMSYSFSVN